MILINAIAAKLGLSLYLQNIDNIKALEVYFKYAQTPPPPPQGHVY